MRFKYRNSINGGSKLEERVYAQLLLQEKAGEIKNIQRQVKFLLQEGFKHRGKAIREIAYIADFTYQTAYGVDVVLEVKGSKAIETKDYKIKIKLFLKRYGESWEFRTIYGEQVR